MNILDAGFKLILGIKSVFSKSTYINIKPDNKYSSPPSHLLLDDLLKAFVEDNGQVDYKGLLNKKSVLTEYLTLLSDNHPNKQSWSKNEQLAYWINAYNAFTVKLIMDNYPVKSIKDGGHSNPSDTYPFPGRKGIFITSKALDTARCPINLKIARLCQSKDKSSALSKDSSMPWDFIMSNILSTLWSLKRS